ncbi:MAG: nicotinate-nucleotide adenylyltransferase [Cyanobacteria bacterium P01_D01_bin.105]
MMWAKQSRVALFGTSADPPHMGHRGILAWLMEEFDQVAVWAAVNPYKPNQSPLGDRAEMLRLLIKTLPNEASANGTTRGSIEVCQSLSDRYSIHSIARARARWPQATFSFVVGADLIAQLPKWYQAKEIFSQAEILIFPRPGYPIDGPALQTLRQQATVRIAHPPYQHNIASSRYRADNCNSVPDDLPPVIRDYIRQRNLYPCHPTPSAKVSTHR